MQRRDFLKNGLKTGLLAGFGAVTWSVFLPNATANAVAALRPPGAASEGDFLKTCIKCGECVRVCPYDTLRLAGLKDPAAIGTPYFIARDIPCYMCQDVPCVEVCPTNALSPSRLQTDGKMDINKAKMGVAVVDDKSCIAYWGIQCDACYRACPLLGKAIKIEYAQNQRTGKHAFLLPSVDPDFCTGCGLCEKACVTKKAAIRVLPLDLVRGEVGEHYVKGWDKNDEARLLGAGKESSRSKSQKSVIRSLNDAEDLLDD